MTNDVVKTLAGMGTVTNPLLRQMIDALPVAIYVTDAEGRLTYFNAAAATLSGRVPQLGVDQWCVTWKLFLPDGRPLPQYECPMAIALQGGDVAAGLECLAERPDGQRFWFAPYPAVIRDAQGQITGGINLLVDITARKKAQSEAEVAALSLGAIVDSSDDAIISKDLHGTITSWNKSAERMFGYTAEEIVGKSITLLIPPDRQNEEPEFLARLRKGERVDHFETMRRRKDGTLLDISLTISPVKNALGEIIGASKIARDTTEAKRAERNNRLLSAIVDSSDDAIISKDLNGTITSWNSSAERLFGYTAAEAIGKSVTILIPEDRLDEEPKILGRLRRGERVDHFETIRRKKDGTLLDLSLTISPIRDSEGVTIGASKIARDITERKRAEAEIRRVNQDLEQFAFSASHDLQEPLRNVKIYSELLSRRYGDKFEGEALEFLGFLSAGATRMEMLVRDLLAYTQVTGRQESTEETDANEVLAQTLDVLAPTISQAGGEVASDLLPSVRIHRTHLQQLFQNVIGNAIKYRGHEPPRVYVTAARQPGFWVFSVVDNGIGIAREYHDHVFGLFKRLHNTVEYSGTGIGLAICKRIVEQYHGRIWVESEPGKGSTFRFTLPV
jgi:PAS domain S-box-containing protein